MNVKHDVDFFPCENRICNVIYTPISFHSLSDEIRFGGKKSEKPFSLSRREFCASRKIDRQEEFHLLLHRLYPDTFVIWDHKTRKNGERQEKFPENIYRFGKNVRTMIFLSLFDLRRV